MRSTPAVLADVREALARDGRVLIRDAHLDTTGLAVLLRSLGDTHAVEDPFSAAVGPRTPAPRPHSNRASPALPLHRDGALIDRPTRLIAFSALDTSDDGHLETVDSVRALREFDAGLRDALHHATWEYRLRDRGPFAHLPEGWFSRPTFVDGPHGQALNTILPEHDGETPQPWEVRLRGVRQVDARAFFTTVDAALRTSSTFDSHAWASGDVIVIDNDRVLHGTSAVPAGSRHHVVRTSV